MATAKELEIQLGETVILQGRQVQVVGLAPEENDVGGTYVYPTRTSAGHLPINPHRYYPRTGLIEHQPVTSRGSRMEDAYLLQGFPNPSIPPTSLGLDYTEARFVHSRFSDFHRP